jgi:hypothetical protein
MAEAKYWSGIAFSIWEESAQGKKDTHKFLSDMRKRGLDSRYEDTRKLQALVVERFRQGNYPSADEAARRLLPEILKFDSSFGKWLYQRIEDISSVTRYQK